jgi:hypothetical protein
VPQPDPISKRAQGAASSDRLFRIAERTLADVEDAMASGGDRQVNYNGSTGGAPQDSMAGALAQEVGRLQHELRKTQELNREITERN